MKYIPYRLNLLILCILWEFCIIVSSMDNLALALGSEDGYTIVDTMVRESSNSEFAYLELDGYNTISMAVSQLRENKHKKLFLNHILTGLEEVPL